MSKKKKIILGIIIILLVLLIGLWGAREWYASKHTYDSLSAGFVSTAEPEINFEKLEKSKENLEKRSAWENILGWDNCQTVAADLYGPGVYEYELANNDSIILVLCRVGGTSNTYRLYHYDKTVQEASRLKIDLYEAYSGGTRMAKYDTFASIEDYSDFSSTGTSLRIHDRSNGLTTCGIDGTYEWNDGIKNYEIKSFKGNLDCDGPIEEINWPVLY